MEQLCRSCKIEKKLSEFHKDITKPLGFRNICKMCYKEYTSREDVRNKRLLYHKEYDFINKDKKVEYRKRTKDKAKARSRKHELKKKYDLTIEDYSQMCENQGNRCLICSKEVNLVIDHSHKTNLVRGLLCTKCNTGLGMFEDNPLFMEQAIKYLRNLPMET